MENTWICPYCSAEVERGLINLINHRCKEERPSESIESHRRELDMQRRANEEENIWRRVWPYMTREEIIQYIILSMSGQMTHTGNDTIVLMGREAMDRLQEFKNAMIEKYL